MNLKNLAFLLLSLLPIGGSAQTFTTISGIVVDDDTGVALTKVSIRIAGLGVVSNEAGRFTLDVSRSLFGDTVSFSHVGYRSYSLPLSEIVSPDSLIIKLTSEATLLDAVSVHSAFWLKQYSPEELREDYEKFYTLMEKTHTGLFDFLPEETWRALKDSSMRLFEYPMNHSDFYKLIALHVGKVKNEHTKHGVTDWWYKQKQNIFPFNVKYFSDKLYVSESLVKDLNVSKGSEILSINGRRPGEIKAMIWPYIPGDGFIETGRMASLNDYFPWFYSLFVEEAETYNIKIRTISGEEITIETRGLADSFSHLSFQQVFRWKKSSLELQIDDSLKTAYFRIEDSHAFKDSIQVYFNRVRDHSVKYLIIDLRGAGGIRTEEHVAELYSYLVKVPYRVYERIEVKSNDYRLFDKDYSFRPYAKSLKTIKEKYMDKLKDSGKGYFLWANESYMGMLEPAKLNFDGKVFILTDGRNCSASTDFTSLAAQLDNVSIVGEETGGEYRSYISGAMFGLVLPNSKVGVKIPTWKSVLAIEEDPTRKGRGVIPDYVVQESLHDFLNGRDTVRDYVFELVRSKTTIKE